MSGGQNVASCPMPGRCVLTVQIAFLDLVFSFLLGNMVPPDKAASQVASRSALLHCVTTSPWSLPGCPRMPRWCSALLRASCWCQNAAQLFPGPGIWDSPLMGFCMRVLATRPEMTRKGAPSPGMPGPAGPHGRSAVWQEEQPLGISKFAVLQSQTERKKKSA